MDAMVVNILSLVDLKECINLVNRVSTDIGVDGEFREYDVEDFMRSNLVPLYMSDICPIKEQASYRHMNRFNVFIDRL